MSNSLISSSFSSPSYVHYLAVSSPSLCFVSLWVVAPFTAGNTLPLAVYFSCLCPYMQFNSNLEEASLTDDFQPRVLTELLNGEPWRQSIEVSIVLHPRTQVFSCPPALLPLTLSLVGRPPFTMRAREWGLAVPRSFRFLLTSSLRQAECASHCTRRRFSFIMYFFPFCCEMTLPLRQQEIGFYSRVATHLSDVQVILIINCFARTAYFSYLLLNRSLLACIFLWTLAIVPLYNSLK